MIMVGRLYTCVRTERWRWSQAAHLFCDTRANLEELHEFARKLGLKRSWFQSRRGTLSHYDLTASKRRQALTAGAVSVDQKTEVNYIRAWRSKDR